MLQGWGVERTARFAGAVSSIKFLRLRGRAAIHTLEAAERFFKDGVIDYTEIDKRVEFYKDGIFNRESRCRHSDIDRHRSESNRFGLKGAAAKVLEETTSSGSEDAGRAPHAKAAGFY